jgi:hypothetical protein
VGVVRGERNKRLLRFSEETDKGGIQLAFRVPYDSELQFHENSIRFLTLGYFGPPVLTTTNRAILAQGSMPIYAPKTKNSRIDGD